MYITFASVLHCKSLEHLVLKLLHFFSSIIVGTQDPFVFGRSFPPKLCHFYHLDSVLEGLYLIELFFIQPPNYAIVLRFSVIVIKRFLNLRLNCVQREEKLSLVRFREIEFEGCQIAVYLLLINLSSPFFLLQLYRLQFCLFDILFALFDLDRDLLD